MTLQTLTQSFPWTRYSKKLLAKMDKPRCMGFFNKEQSEERAMRLIEGREGKLADGNSVILYWLVDPDDGIIVDAKFQAYGQSALIGAAEVACELVIGKNYDQAKRISVDLLDKQVRDKPDEAAFPKEASSHLNIILGAMENAAEKCLDIPLASSYVASPTPLDIGEVLEGGYPGWIELSLKQKINLVEEVLDRDVRPYIELDAGGVVVLDLVNDWELHIAYQGSCTSCFSATGTTLSYIQQIIRAKLHASLIVIPDLSTFHQH
ncbi:iron-sulfur cluster assembly scaffold protein [Candidatus Protochlamydia sp. W-9]|uniref:iron-sulfur cluster assembly scaffold protein n=1 Tax=Candidatus Protochlamydia sp. W-9 TaxID=1785087 RepID=UPI00096A9651|nr:iron-sulfur cluster assembly scaffold protein [Candidatus Protochlamydia sp. W-9]